MPKLNINVGTSPNTRNGDTIRAAFVKVNSNFSELYSIANADVQIPSQTSNSGKYLTTNGTTLSWGTVTAGADLGYFKIQGEYLGTKDNPDTGNWGGHWMYIDSGGESNAGISIPSVASQSAGGEFTIYNNHADAGAIRFLTNTGTWYLNQDGTTTFPNNTIDAGTNQVYCGFPPETYDDQLTVLVGEVCTGKEYPCPLIIDKNSSLAAISFLNKPLITDVVMEEPVSLTPRQLMHICCALTTTANA